MNFPAELFSPNNGLSMILLAGIAIYIASRAGRDAMLGGGPVVGWRIGLGHWIPVAILAVWAGATDGMSIQTGHGTFPTYHGTVAIGIVFGTSVGGLLLAGGAALLVTPTPSALPRRSRLLWSMVVPVGLLALVAGFKGSVTVAGALALFAEGLVILAAVLRPPASEPVGTADVFADSPAPKSASIGIRIIQFILACCLAAVAAWVALHGVDRLVADSSRATPGLLTSILLCPLLVLPSVGSATEFAQRRKSAEVVDAAVWQAIGNICFLVPLMLVASRIGYFCRNREFVLKAFSVGNAIPFKSFPFPVTVWRLDLLFVLAAGMLLLPVAAGRWSLSKRDGLGMTIAYGVYLFLPIMLRLLQPILDRIFN